MSDDKPHNGGQWTEARKDTFIKGLLRAGHPRWGPRNACIQEARVRRGWYRCDGCKQEVPASVKIELKTRPGVFKKVKNIHADHIEPVIDPAVGRQSWDEVIERMFVERDGYQALCHKCHSEKTEEERAIATERRRAEKDGRK